jgi:protein ImuA
MLTADVLDQLRTQIQLLERGALKRTHCSVATASARLNAWLPQRGFLLGSFVEILTDTPGSGAFARALAWAQPLAEVRPLWAVLDTGATFYPPVAQALGWPVKRLVLIRTAPQDGGWAFAQLLLTRDLGACFWASESMDNMVFRRLQLAAERGGGLGVVLRPAAALRKPCWGSLRLRVEACGPQSVRVQLLHARGQSNVPRDVLEVAW